jgi:hypothetical protein
MNAASETVTAMSQGLTAGRPGAAALASTGMEAAVIARPLKCTQTVGDKPILEPGGWRSWRETLADSFASFIIREEFCSSFTGKQKHFSTALEYWVSRRFRPAGRRGLFCLGRLFRR